MATAAASGTAARHPWLAALQAGPEAGVRALVGGYADIPPYGRAEPADAAASLLFGLDEDDPARAAFDHGCQALLQALGDAIPPSDDTVYERYLASLDRLFAVIRRIRPPATVRRLHQNYIRWAGLAETAVVDRGLDLRREYWLVLALTQDQRPAEPRRLMPLWLDLCAEAGSAGRYDETYLDVGLVGLRRLPLGADDDSNEEAVCHGIARWAARQRPDRLTFLARWREIEAAYPRTPSYWPPLVEDVIAATEEHLSTEARKGGVSFPAAAWWREELELSPVRAGQRPAPSGRGRAIEPLPLARTQAVLEAAARPLSQVRPMVDRLLSDQLRYADATGDTFYLIRTACNVGMRLLRGNPGESAARGEVAATLARQALHYAPTNVYAWALWRDGLAAWGALAAAEEVGWEALRRFPEDPQRRTQLATLLGSQPGRAGEAEHLLRDTVALFPREPAARPQLATLLAYQLDRPADAANLLREAIRVLPDDPYSHNQLAILLADRLGDRAGAIRLLQDLQRRQAGNKMTKDLLARLLAGRRGRSALPSARPVARLPVDPGVDLASGRARRALFRVETADGPARAAALEEVRRLLVADPGLAYTRYVAQRTGAAAAGGRIETEFAFAFDRAAREGSAQAFGALAASAFGLRPFVARSGLVLLSGGTDFVVPTGANDAEPGSAARRFVTLTGEIGAAMRLPNADRTLYLRLVADFAAADLSLALAA